MCNLEGKVALVTGASGKRGIGFSAARLFAERGADVAVNDVSSQGIRCTEDDRKDNWQGLKSVVKEIRALERRGLAIEADITSGHQVKEMVDKVMAEFGKIDILVNNAGILGPKKPVLEGSEEDWYGVLKVNIMGTYLCAKAVAKTMIERGKGGKIINLASVNGKFYYGRNLGPYTVSKFGVVGLTQVLAYELAHHKIQVNAVCPGYIATEIATGESIREDMRSGVSLEEATAKAYINELPQIPLGRAGQPEDVANLMLFLASSESDYMTGQSINVNGGSLMCH